MLPHNIGELMHAFRTGQADPTAARLAAVEQHLSQGPPTQAAPVQQTTGTELLAPPQAAVAAPAFVPFQPAQLTTAGAVLAAMSQQRGAGSADPRTDMSASFGLGRVR
jgi:hypothetical protein